MTPSGENTTPVVIEVPNVAKTTQATRIYKPGPSGFVMYVPTKDIETIKLIFPDILIGD